MEAAAALSSATAGLSSSRRTPLSLSQTLLQDRRSRTGSRLLIVANANPSPGPKGSDGRRQRGGRNSPVDEFLPLLHARIREVEAAEKLDRGISEGTTARDLTYQPPAETDKWAGWERRYYLTGGYHLDVLGAVGALQALLMDMRPAAIIGAVALLLVGLVTTGIAVSASFAGALAHVTALHL